MYSDFQRSDTFHDAEENLPIARFRYLPLESLEAFDTECETGLERLLYLQSLIADEVE